MYFVYNKSRRTINELYIAMKVAKHTAVEKKFFYQTATKWLIGYSLNSTSSTLYNEPDNFL